MANVNDIEIGALGGEDVAKQIPAVVRQLNDWGRSISNEDRTKIYKDNDGNPRIIIGLLPDGTHGLVISKEGVSVLDVFN